MTTGPDPQWLADHADELDLPEQYRTKSGKVLTDEDIERFAAEAEEGYDPEQIRALTPEESDALRERHGLRKRTT